MQKVFENPTLLEKSAKEKFAVPEFLMMENAARALADFVLKNGVGTGSGGRRIEPDEDAAGRTWLGEAAVGRTGLGVDDAGGLGLGPVGGPGKFPTVLIFCGKGNNGGDGYALARLLQGHADIRIFYTEEPTAQEAAVQFEMCRRLGIPLKKLERWGDFDWETVGDFAGDVAAGKACAKRGLGLSWQAGTLTGCGGSTGEAADNLQNVATALFLVDCIYGTGFHGNLPQDVRELFGRLNTWEGAVRLACDIPSGLSLEGASEGTFCADYTISMGSQKLAFYSDQGTNLCGKILVANLGIERGAFEGEENKSTVEATLDSARASNQQDSFESNSPNGSLAAASGQATAVAGELSGGVPATSQINLIEPSDIRLPYRTDRSAHKGTFGHTTVVAGEKSGAGIIAATAAMNFGSGLTSLLKSPKSNLGQFQISPELMIAEKIPAKTTCLCLGSGLGDFSDDLKNQVCEWFESAKAPAILLDADMFSYPGLPQFLDFLNGRADARILLTPHLAEAGRLANLCGWQPESATAAAASGDGSEKSQKTPPFSGYGKLLSDIKNRLAFGKFFVDRYPQSTLIIKSAVTYIFAQGGQSANRANAQANQATTSAEVIDSANHAQIFICNDGGQNLAKGGSGDVLAGLAAGLLAQGYSGRDAAITGVEAHALASLNLKGGPEAFDLTPMKLIEEITKL